MKEVHFWPTSDRRFCWYDRRIKSNVCVHACFVHENIAAGSLCSIAFHLNPNQWSPITHNSKSHSFIHFRFVHGQLCVCVSLHVLLSIDSVMLTHTDWNCVSLTLWLWLQFVSFIFIYLTAFCPHFDALLFSCLDLPCHVLPLSGSLCLLPNLSFRLQLFWFSHILWFQQD